MANKIPAGYLAREDGVTKQMRPIIESAGEEDAGKIGALDETGRYHLSLMPIGVGPSIDIFVASENLSAGKFVNIHLDAGITKARLADATNNRQADGFVLDSVEAGEQIAVYKIDSNNTKLSDLSPGKKHYLATAGGVTDTPYDESDPENEGYISQYLGKAKNSNELITEDDGIVIL